VSQKCLYYVPIFIHMTQTWWGLWWRWRPDDKGSSIRTCVSSDNNESSYCALLSLNYPAKEAATFQTLPKLHGIQYVQTVFLANSLPHRQFSHYIHVMWGAGIAQSVQRLATGWTVRDRIPVGAGFSAPVHTGPGTHPASYTMGTESFPGVKRPGRGVALTTHPI